MDDYAASLALGIKTIKSYLKNLPNTAGVYRMLSESGEVLYVGKAKNLKARVASYTRPYDASRRIQRMVSLTRKMEFVTARSEAEALLMESSLIKSLDPRFNVALKDDKSFPEILLTANHDFARAAKHRGPHKIKGDYFGPFASIWSVNEMIYLLQRLFLLRTCSDNVFKNRSRPCLLHQIKRCSAPCTGEITLAEYKASVKAAKSFLKGDTKDIRLDFTQKMEQAAQNMAYEEAAVWRDRLRALTQIQSKQSVNIQQKTDMDAIAIYEEAGKACVQIFFFRAGRNQGTYSYFPRHDKEDALPHILSAFMGQFYSRHKPPAEILVNIMPYGEISDDGLDDDGFISALEERRGGKVKIIQPQLGQKADIINQALLNAQNALSRKMNENSSWNEQLVKMAELLKLSEIPSRIEVYDNSHIQGTDMIGAMIVASKDGFEKNQYRKYNIKDPSIAPGDDFAMMKEVMKRRFIRLQKGEGILPDLILIDGGKGQLSAVMEMVEEYGISEVNFVAVSKGVDRHAGKEQLHLSDGTTLYPNPKDTALWMIQKLRDEAHRFAIGTHRKKRGKNMSKSGLDAIAGIGAKRKKALMNHFGSLRDIKAASIEDISQVEGISLKQAETIFNHLQGHYTG